MEEDEAGMKLAAAEGWRVEMNEEQWCVLARGGAGGSGSQSRQAGRQTGDLRGKKAVSKESKNSWN